MHTIIEPFRIKMTEELPITTRGDREARLASAHNNVFLLDAEDITIDLLTDSGTGAMSAHQWAALMLGDERRGKRVLASLRKHGAREITGFKHIFPSRLTAMRSRLTRSQSRPRPCATSRRISYEARTRVAPASCLSYGSDLTETEPLYRKLTATLAIAAAT